MRLLFLWAIRWLLAPECPTCDRPMVTGAMVHERPRWRDGVWHCPPCDAQSSTYCVACEGRMIVIAGGDGPDVSWCPACYERAWQALHAKGTP